MVESASERIERILNECGNTTKRYSVSIQGLVQLTQLERCDIDSLLHSHNEKNISVAAEKCWLNSR